ncbi:N-acetylmuramic acid 6-phosphate etherase [Engelhardtia mirabilis]|uniref:N-acetylmuramic acid 6-phosphate etherase n=1 Tax=Engelhardtia mirabilis TaxID=2528011 RepID=A0A518BHM5_9BACT|nr:N-acetylmuramic acid 6-phosphate etherase [Planctomycetes bacterium Pla133]QDV00805.1 N-acetylmuramic acid 6-phosphate etherase [Planctomycetes bacterium Pla86]
MTDSPSDDVALATTEGRLAAAAGLDGLSSLELVRLMNSEDARVAAAVGEASEAIARGVDAIALRLGRGGRLVYIGAGTSGRLGVLDASECPPTFSTPPGQVIGLIAGGREALTSAVEGAEDDGGSAVRDLDSIELSERDVLVGIAASGSTPYVLRAIARARERGAFTIGLSCVAGSDLSRAAELAITVVVGPEVVSGSTRLKAGTATKLVLNQLSTGAMVRLGKTYGDLMVDLQAKNAKLRGRVLRILGEIGGIDGAAAQALLARCDGELKTAVVAARTGETPERARERLAAAGGVLRAVIGPCRGTYGAGNSCPSGD